MISLRNDSGEFLDINQDFAFTKQSINFFDFKLKGDVSTNFKILNNSENRKFLGYYSPTQVDTGFNAQTYDLLIGGNAIKRVLLYFQNVDEKEIDAFVTTGNANWINSLTFNLKEIETDRFNTTNTYSGNFPSTTTEGITWPVLDVGFKSNKGHNHFFGSGGGEGIDNLSNPFDSPFGMRDILPCVFAHTLLREVLTKAGINYSGSLFNDHLFLNTIITNDSVDIKTPQTFISKRTLKTYLSGTQNITSVGSYTKINLTELITNTGYFSGNGYKLDQDYNVDIKFYIKTDVSQTYDVSIFRNGSLYTPLGVSFNATEVTINQSFAFNKKNVYELYITPTSSSFNIISCFADFMPTELDVSNVKLCALAPSLKASEFVKWAIITFGCVANFNTYSNTLTINKLKDYKHENAMDWSNYLVSCEQRYSEISRHNYIKMGSTLTQESGIDNYNKVNTVKFGEADIDTGFGENSKTLYQSPFAPAMTIKGTTNAQLSLAHIPFYNLEDDLKLSYTNTLASGGFTEFVGSGWPFTSDSISLIIRVDDAKNVNSGYFKTDAVNPATATSVKVLTLPYVAALSSGYIYTQKITKNTITPRVLILTNNIPASYWSSASALTYGNSATSSSTAAYAYFTKPKTGFNIDNLKLSLSYGEINLPDYSDATIEEIYYGSIFNIISNPPYRCRIVLPFDIFNSVSFDQDTKCLVYLKKYQSYFLIGNIANFVDELTPVECNLYKL